MRYVHVVICLIFPCRTYITNLPYEKRAQRGWKLRMRGASLCPFVALTPFRSLHQFIRPLVPYFTAVAKLEALNHYRRLGSTMKLHVCLLQPVATG